MANRRIVLACLSAIGLAALCGCGSGNALDLVPVRGEISYNGKPLDHGNVVYLPDDSPGARQATGAIHEDGTFVMSTLKKDDGVTNGKFKIVVYSYEAHPGEPETREEIEAMAKAGGIKRGQVIPEKYIDAKTSGLSDVVDENHSGFKKLELTD